MGELIGKILMLPFTFLIPSHYRPIKAIDIAKAMICRAKNNDGIHETLHYYQVMEWARKYKQDKINQI